VQLGFAAQPGDREGQRVFDVKLQGNVVLKDFDIFKEAGAANKAVIKEFKDIKVENDLTVEFVPKVSNPKGTQAPIINFIQSVREDVRKVPEVSAHVKLLEKSKAKVMLKKAKAENDLDTYHTVFDAAPTVEIKLQALEGMADIGSPKSLSRIARYCKDVHPVLLDYKDVDPEIKNGAVKAYATIANNIANNKKQKAIKMLNYALPIASRLDIHQKIANSLENLGIKVDAEAAKDGFITRWHLIGPFPWDSKVNMLDKVFVDEPNIDISKSYQVGDKILKWEKFVSERRMIDLEKILGTHADVAVCAYAEVLLPEEQELLLKIGSSDGFKCWFNSEVVGRFDGSRDWKADEDVLKVKGKKGVNTVLLKVSRSSSGWSFSVKKI